MKKYIFNWCSTKYYSKKDSYRIYYSVMALMLLIVAILVELFIFNYRHWTSIGNSPERVDFINCEGLTKNENGTYSVVSDAVDIEILDINGEVSSLFVEIADIDSLNSTNGSIITIDFDAKDTSHHNYYYLNRRTVSSLESRSYYMSMHLYGDANAIKLHPYIAKDSNIVLNLIINPIIPIFFRWERIVILYAFFLLVLFCNPGSILHKVKYRKLGCGYKYSILFTFLIVNALILYWVNGVNPFYQSEAGINTIQYQELAEAFEAGQLSLLDEPGEKLRNMDNPYDMGYRDELMEFDEYYFDHAYYDGKYYVYFGVVPCALIYFPYYLITGEHIHNHTVCYIGVLLILLGMLLVMDGLIEKFYKKCSVAEWYILTQLFLLGSYVTYVTKRPDLYSVPIIYAVAFALWGLGLFLKSMPNDKTNASVLNKGCLTAGSICTALIAGCRPQLFLVVILDVIVMKDYIFSREYLKSKDGIKSLVSVFTPMVIIGTLLMLYNGLRFGSPFDFGAFYNLTFNDMRYRGFVWDRLPYGAFVYLFRPFENIPEYPYFGNIEQATKYMGVTIQETTYGGILVACPFAIISLSSVFYARKMKKKFTPWLLCVVSLAIALFVMFFDTTNSGILARYFFDFSFLWMLCAVIASMIILGMEKLKGTSFRTTFVWILIVCIVFEVIYQILVFMLDSGDYLRGNRADLFYHYYYMFGFGI